ncbi:cell wall hydrolase [Bacillus sp. YZJH907-2]|uniref:Cell wall hydrolase n=1 Tax=Halalkalibacter suaedae TaxID=2822140 RepID=A0A940WQI6_9BACI|nr:cell wall hydrolase [Bacillus suaedae]
MEYDLLARLVVSESRGEPYSGKVAVANVVLKRVESNEFPNTIREVIYQPGQFQVVSNGLIDRRKPSEKSKTAVTEALNTDNGDALYFYNPEIATNRWLDQLTTVEVIGDHTFKK